jgi:DNA-binding NarL/FixJ family response regulator
MSSSRAKPLTKHLDGGALALHWRMRSVTSIFSFSARFGKVRICLAQALPDDFAGFRDAICSMLSDCPDLLVVAEASDGLEAVRKAEELQPDLIVLDLIMPKLNGLEATRRIRKLSPTSKIIIVSLDSSDDFVQEALRAGAAGYVTKADIFNQLLPAIEAVLQGGQWFVEQMGGIR